MSAAAAARRFVRTPERPVASSHPIAIQRSRLVLSAVRRRGHSAAKGLLAKACGIAVIQKHKYFGFHNNKYITITKRTEGRRVGRFHFLPGRRLAPRAAGEALEELESQTTPVLVWCCF